MGWYKIGARKIRMLSSWGESSSSEKEEEKEEKEWKKEEVEEKEWKKEEEREGTREAKYNNLEEIKMDETPPSSSSHRPI